MRDIWKRKRKRQRVTHWRIEVFKYQGTTYGLTDDDPKPACAIVLPEDMQFLHDFEFVTYLSGYVSCEACGHIMAECTL